MSEEVSTPAKLAEQSLKEQHRTAFNLKAFGLDSDGNFVATSTAPRKESKAMMQSEWSSIFSVLSKGKSKEDLAILTTEQQQNYKQFKKEHDTEWREEQDKFQKWKHVYAVEEGQLANGDVVKRLVRIEPKRDASEPRRLVIPRLEVFDVIYNAHVPGHLGSERTQLALAQTHYSISQKMVNIFCKLCYNCKQKQPVLKAPKGAR